ncbi:hypothetical protein A3I40_01020 [Candidatus Uhrbacteria bacterium RIFCSPLOWO2_02_FULL_48_12]|uniref:Fimbrial assembly protein n=1 Tax=Candidatus Uhrbacteria bacterium RIFCSPLOWO2_02_FULL_48_12 TaxID=1802407 RepID=A0A1F7V8S9_9BACT|nr:MAG: hypothetical protein A3I40_01020 [Candidatus Uhrbacteria bacterium RIFCSPLOWO2_02_FULL_48_12]
MTNLNLIPPAYKDRLRLQRLYSLVKKFLGIVILYTIFLAITMLVARFVLENNFQRIVSETTLVTTENRKIEQQITKMNKQIAAAKSIQKNSVPWAEFTIALSRLVPNGVVVNSLKFDSAAGNRSAINGQANTRETLLAFESRLKEAPFVEKVDLPFKNKQEKMNIYFTITLTIKPEAAPPLN